VILVLRALGVGDLVAAVPALRAVRAAFPRRTLALAAPAWLTPLADLIGDVDRLIDVPGLGPYHWPGPRPELAINLHGRGPQSHRLLASAGAGEMWAFANAEAGHRTGPGWHADEHEVDRWCRLLRYYGVPADPDDRSLTVPPVAPGLRGRTVVHPGAKSPTRRWPPERFAAVARALADAGHRVAITGSAAERAVALDVAAAAGLPADTVVAGRTGLGELAGLVAHARLLVSGDTGIAHLATAYGTPSVTLFGPVPPRLWGPPPDRPRHRALWHGTGVDPGDSPDPDPHPALLRITVDEVLAAAGAGLEHGFAGAGRGTSGGGHP
jgi:ADP-heptose:LPS heptosyltransferase